MKTLILLFLLLPFIGIAQQNRVLTPVGAGMVYYQPITVNNSTTLTNIYVDTIYANTFTPGRRYDVDIYCRMTTPLTLFPTITMNLLLGSTSISNANTALLGASLTNKNFRIHIAIFASTFNSQYVNIEMFSDNSTILLGSTYFSKGQLTTEDLTLDKAVKLTSQFSSAVNLATTTLYIDNIYKFPF